MSESEAAAAQTSAVYVNYMLISRSGFMMRRADSAVTCNVHRTDRIMPISEVRLFVAVKCRLYSHCYSPVLLELKKLTAKLAIK
jgi:hypothetical protein